MNAALCNLEILCRPFHYGCHIQPNKEHQMKKEELMLGVACAAELGAVACSYEREDDDRGAGGYERNSSYTDEQGTRTENRDSTEVTVDNHGKRHTSVKSKTTRDPKGLFNKKTTHESDEEIDQK